MTTLAIISDTHNHHWEIENLPPGDILIHCGDFTNIGTKNELNDFNDWLGTLDYRYIICCSGNHDFLEPLEAQKLITNAIYLQDTSVIIEGIKFYGSPWQPKFWGAFNMPRGMALAKKWAEIPNDVDVLITHCPPFMILDGIQISSAWKLGEKNLGCEQLSKRVFGSAKDLPNLKVHCFGHIHPAYGEMTLGDVIFVNAALCDDWNNLANDPVVVEV